MTNSDLCREEEMNNDVIELAQKIMLALSNERELIGKYPNIFFGHYLINAENIAKICNEIDSLRNELAKYENMEPVAWKNMVTGEIYTEFPQSNKTHCLAVLYYQPPHSK
ncbi:hypothetical protein [Xenorhabdus hominickii]|uniref:Uncharacterized protein n=1 Tax=Xenorhabdus hominickii TaxID=351679 RepID=A0A2G0Q624_XENHO|nr:hypothetical protein [Xenorhabdus hominickii]AOM39568.1 hypothetical protein A9255_02525 [Xenorhabdus hominickii]PHM54651.1 hypothetical protein Xhom_02601 [Xenorhabdus hominickii]